MEGVLATVTKEYFFASLLMFLLGFAAAFIGYFIYRKLAEKNPVAADILTAVAV